LPEFRADALVITNSFSELSGKGMRLRPDLQQGGGGRRRFSLGAILAPIWNQLSSMPNLSIKNVPDDVVQRLRERARANHRSLQGELLHLAIRAAEADEPVGVPSPHLRNAPLGSKSIEEIAAEHRQRQPQPLSSAPLAVDLIRRDRDAR
jgi:plasmid stability protein